MSETILKQTQRTSDMLANVSRAVAIILWVVLTQALVWPFAAVISGYQDEPLLSGNVLFIAGLISMVVAFGITRWVFPINYERVTPDQETDE